MRRLRVLRLARGIRHGPARLLHPRRRRAALARLRDRPPPHGVLFVCHGNIYRSPFAARLAETTLGGPDAAHIDIGSAGFVGPGRPSPGDAVEAAALWGIDLAAHRSRRLTEADVRRAALVVVVEPRQRRALRWRFGCPRQKVLILGDLDPEPIERRAIRDPFGQPCPACVESYARIDRCIRQLAAAIVAGAAGHHGPAGTRDSGPVASGSRANPRQSE